MRSLRIYAIKNGGAEQYVGTAYSVEDGKMFHRMLKTQKHFDEMVVRDVLGGTMIHLNLSTDENLMHYA